MKKIAITQRLISNDSYYELREGLDVQWGKLFKELGFLPIVLPIEYSFEDYFNDIQIDGIMLTGGNDLNSLNPNEDSFLRDTFEKKLLKYAIDNNIPVFGVCRGLQLIAEYFEASFVSVSDQVAIKHGLKANKESKFFDLLNQIQVVNSYHNYAVNNISEQLIVSATSENGIIKAIEHKKYKIFAQMWHSEREMPFNEQELNLIKKFFN